MAVFTKLDLSDVCTLLSTYDIGGLDDFREISEGIENTNYFLDTRKNGVITSWVLTIFENLDASELPYFSDLTQHLAHASFKVPAPVLSKHDEAIFQLKGKYGVIVPCLSGKSIASPSEQDCRTVGSWLARMHVSLKDFDKRRVLVRSLAWMQAQRDALQPFMSSDEFAVLESFIARYQNYKPLLDACPQGAVHGDLFRDNVLFVAGQVTGVIDFYHACDATLLFDLAVIANDWTVNVQGQHQKHLVDALVVGYQQERTWTTEELEAWPFSLELAALRFWISRLVSLHVPGYQQQAVSGETLKNPDDMKAILLSLQGSPD